MSVPDNMLEDPDTYAKCYCGECPQCHGVILDGCKGHGYLKICVCPVCRICGDVLLEDRENLESMVHDYCERRGRKRI